MKRRAFSELEIKYFSNEILSQNTLKQKLVLQLMDRMIRTGYYFRPQDKIAIENMIIGILNNGKSDIKIKKWTIVILSHISSNVSSSETVIGAIKNNVNEPQILIAGIAALFKFKPFIEAKDLKQYGLEDPTSIGLAALQSVDHKNLKIKLPKIDIFKSDENILKHALVLVGLNKAPPLLFDPKHSNATIIQELAKHHDPIVTQYAFWAACEQVKINHSKIKLELDKNKLFDYPGNTRAYYYKLSIAYNNKNNIIDIIANGALDSEVDARMGLAVGLRDFYTDGCETLITDWFYKEEEETIRICLLEHMIKNSELFSDYFDLAIQEYENYVKKTNDKVITQLDIAASGQKIYTEFKNMKYPQDTPLFDYERKRSITVNNYIVNNQGAIGSVAQNGNSDNSGNLNLQITMEDIEQIKTALKNILNVLNSDTVNNDALIKIKEDLKEAISNPNKNIITKVLEGFDKLSTLSDKMNKILNLGEKVAPYLTVIISLMNKFS